MCLHALLVIYIWSADILHVILAGTNTMTISVLLILYLMTMPPLLMEVPYTCKWHEKWYRISHSNYMIWYLVISVYNTCRYQYNDNFNAVDCPFHDNSAHGGGGEIAVYVGIHSFYFVPFYRTALINIYCVQIPTQSLLQFGWIHISWQCCRRQARSDICVSGNRFLLFCTILLSNASINIYYVANINPIRWLL